MNPPMITKVIPSETIISGPNWRSMLIRLAGFMNLGSTTAVMATSSAIMISTKYSFRKVTTILRPGLGASGLMAFEAGAPRTLFISAMINTLLDALFVKWNGCARSG